MFPITHIIFAQKVPTSVGIFSSATIRFEISFRFAYFLFILSLSFRYDSLEIEGHFGI